METPIRRLFRAAGHPAPAGWRPALGGGRLRLRRSGLAFGMPGAVLLAALVVGTGLGSGWGQPVDAIRRSVVRIAATSQEPNYRVPWEAGGVVQGVGAGFVIGGERIMTNAHVVSNARFLTVAREGDPRQYVARVEHIAHDCDLAVLRIEEKAELFFADTRPLEFGGIPEIESAVSAYGYPLGGDRLSVTRGIVSRVDFSTYSHSGMDAHLVIQVDAAINPGNSGGPVMQEGKVVGVAFQGYRGDVAQNVGYMIPVPVIGRFLRDLADGRYDSYMDLAIGTFELQNPALRKAFGLPDDDRGIMVSSVSPAGSAAGHLQVGDVLLSVDGHAIASDSFVELEGTRVQMSEVVERKLKGEEVRLGILRDGKRSEVAVPLAPWRFLMLANRYDIRPRYVMFAGLLFQPLAKDFLDANPTNDTRVRYFFEHFISDELYVERPEPVVLSEVLPDPINAYLTDFRGVLIDEVNGVKITGLAKLAEALAQPVEFHVIRPLGVFRPIILEAGQAREAQARVKERYRVGEEANLDE